MYKENLHVLHATYNKYLRDAWLYLGNCIWKKGDLTFAKNCLNHALSKGPYKKILCQLSMLERRVAQGVENQVEMVKKRLWIMMHRGETNFYLCEINCDMVIDATCNPVIGQPPPIVAPSCFFMSIL